MPAKAGIQLAQGSFGNGYFMPPTRAIPPVSGTIDIERDRLTHYLFRYPAKFHPPVVRHLIERFTDEHQTILDPFCGSGTLLVEASICGRSATGTDVDPLAVFVSKIKTHRYSMPALKRAAAK